jgi:hypothetical protein
MQYWRRFHPRWLVAALLGFVAIATTFAVPECKRVYGSTTHEEFVVAGSDGQLAIGTDAGGASVQGLPIGTVHLVDQVEPFGAGRPLFAIRTATIEVRSLGPDCTFVLHCNEIAEWLARWSLRVDRHRVLEAGLSSGQVAICEPQYEIIWLGVAHTMMWAFGLLLLCYGSFSAVAVRRASSRFARGACPACGYMLVNQRLCPECGWGRRPSGG